eukprot:8211369-Pyramimonas_sp.AAC.2
MAFTFKCRFELGCVASVPPKQLTICDAGPFIRTMQALCAESAAVGVTLQALVALKNRGQALEIRNMFFDVLKSKGFHATEVKPESGDACPTPLYWEMCVQDGVSIYSIGQNSRQ